MNFIELHRPGPLPPDTGPTVLINVAHIAWVYGNPCKIQMQIAGPPLVVLETYEEVSGLIQRGVIPSKGE